MVTSSEILCETSYHHEGEYTKPREIGKIQFVSDSTLSRGYSKIGELIGETGEQIDIHFLKQGFSVIGVVKSKKQIGLKEEDSNRVIFFLRFKQSPTIVYYPEGIPKDKVKQVDSAYVSSVYRGFGIASYVYARMISLGYIVVSDSAQFTDGKELWKKMARQVHAMNYKIHIIDDENGFMKDDQNTVIVYDGSNIDDAKIWSGGMDMSGQHILLMLK